MKALSIKQPWAWAILNAGKDIENRDWELPRNFKLPMTIAVHASKGLTKDEHLLGSMTIEDISGLRPPSYPMIAERGFILGTVEIVDCLSDSNSDWFFGEFGFVLANPQILAKPIYCKGALSFWQLPAEIEQEILNQINPSGLSGLNT